MVVRGRAGAAPGKPRGRALVAGPDRSRSRAGYRDRRGSGRDIGHNGQPRCSSCNRRHRSDPVGGLSYILRFAAPGAGRHACRLRRAAAVVFSDGGSAWRGSDGRSRPDAALPWP